MQQPLPRPSASPLPSYASRPIAISRSPSFSETIMAIWAWLRGGYRPVPLRRQILEARIVEALVAELEAEDEARAEAQAKARAAKPKGLRLAP
jgi:hypothetical protein